MVNSTEKVYSLHQQVLKEKEFGMKENVLNGWMKTKKNKNKMKTDINNY